MEFALSSKSRGTETPLRPKPLNFTNGALKRHYSDNGLVIYKECLRNHAASLGCHALDGCCEFMPSPLYSRSDPSSLKCAACGCHRNFHRRGDDGDPPSSRSPLALSAPHMLLALSAGHSAPTPTPTHDETNPSTHPARKRKRFRTKFSREQKERMQELSEKLGWKMRKQDEGVVDDFCREIGVGKDVFKVWMHNNKSSFIRRENLAASAARDSSIHMMINDDDNICNTHFGMNGSSSSS